MRRRRDTFEICLTVSFTFINFTLLCAILIIFISAKAYLNENNAAKLNTSLEMTLRSIPKVVLTFEGLPNFGHVGNFYSGLGIDFGVNSLSLIEAHAGGGGNFAGEPSPVTIMFFLVSSSIMNVPSKSFLQEMS